MAAERALRADARRNREAIVAAARSVFENDDHLRFDDFAARAGVGVGTLYRHFPTREALAAAVYQGEVSVICQQALDSTRPPGETLNAFLRAFVEYLIEHVALARALAAIVDEVTRAQGGGELERTIAGLMTAAAADGDIRDDVSPGAVMIALHGIGSATDRPQWEAQARAVAELVIRGLAPR